MTNIVINGVVRSLFDVLSSGIDLEKVFAVYWEARKKAHSGRLPSALDYESWEAFCEADPDSATEFIVPLQTALQLFSERGDVEGRDFDLVPTGSWIQREQIRVTEPLVLYQERKTSGHMQTLFPTERKIKDG